MPILDGELLLCFNPELKAARIAGLSRAGFVQRTRRPASVKGHASGDSWLEELDQSRPWTRQRFGPGDVEPKSMGPPLRRAGGASLPGPCRIFC